MKRKKNKGVTLIALIIIIIVLLILATISIYTFINSRIVDQAGEAKFKTEMKNYKEIVDLYTSEIVNQTLSEDTTWINAGYVLKSAIAYKLIEDITEDDVTIDLKDILPDISEDEEKYIVVYKGEMYYVSNSGLPNNEQYKQWCIEVDIPILEYVPPSGIKNRDGSYQLVNRLYLCTPNILDGFVKEKTRYLNPVGEGGNLKLNPGNWIIDDPSEDWYDYKNQKWANLYVESEGIENYYTWIPRYCYKVNETTQRTDVKFIDLDNSYKEYVEGKSEPLEMTWEELEAEGYVVPDAFTFDGNEIPGYWVSKYTVGEGLDQATIRYEMDTEGLIITIKDVEINTTVTDINPITKYTVALNGKIIEEIDPSDIGNPIVFSGLRNGNNTINLTGLNAEGEVVGSMTQEYEIAIPESPDLSGFNEENTFYVIYDDTGEKIVDATQSIKKDGSNIPDNWYDYTSRKWANIVVRTGSSETYYTWIPRYEYLILGTYADTPATGRTTVKFIDKTKVTPDDGYTIPDAFTFGTAQIPGYWVSKYTVGDIVAPVFTTEIASTSDTITTKGVTGSGTSTSNLVYHYYINGEHKDDDTITSAETTFKFTGLDPGTDYMVMVYVTKAVDSSGNYEYVGSYLKKVTTSDANAPDLSGFSEECTYYVVYDDAGNTIIDESTLIKKDGSNAPEGWYDYSNSKWANIVVKTDTTTIYYTWIPRYEYKILPEQELDTANARIEVTFISKDKTEPTDGYTIPDAFTFGSTQLSGYWVSKYTVGE